MLYILLFFAFILFELFYFQVADRFNIIDKPNERSSHSNITLRGGGIVFYVAVLSYFLISGFAYPWFFIGLTLMTVISFADDVMTLSNQLRLIVHFISVLLMVHELGLFVMPWFYLIITFILVVGVINAYNFMDGINGITAVNSLAIGILLWLANQELNFIESDFLIYTMLGVLAFAVFNFRIQAKCFAGDVGAVSIAFILLFALGKLILYTDNFIYILFMTVYGLDAVWTIVKRLFARENIFQAHRSHLYQYLANEAGFNKLVVSATYGLAQLLIGVLVIYITQYNTNTQIIFSVVLLIVLSVVYLSFKQAIVRRFVRNDTNSDL